MKSRHKWVIGVKCDFPPFGYFDFTGNHRGYDVAIARRFATLSFGRPNRIKLVCVTTPSRIPSLQSSQVDIIISTLTWTSARADVINFSVPYYAATGRLLVPNNSSITSTKDLAGKTVVTTRGALYATWMRNCFKNSTLLEVDGTAAAVIAVKEGRAIDVHVRRCLRDRRRHPGPDAEADSTRSSSPCRGASGSARATRR